MAKFESAFKEQTNEKPFKIEISDNNLLKKR